MINEHVLSVLLLGNKHLTSDVRHSRKGIWDRLGFWLMLGLWIENPFLNSDRTDYNVAPPNYGNLHEPHKTSSLIMYLSRVNYKVVMRWC